MVDIESHTAEIIDEEKDTRKIERRNQRTKI